MPLLSQPEYQATFIEPMHPVEDGGAPFDFWAYYDTIPAADFQGHHSAQGEVVAVYRSDDQQWEHVLVRTDYREVLMVLVLDLRGGKVHGHHLLNMEDQDLTEGEPELWE